MGDLVILIDDKPFTTSVIIAEKTNNTVHSVRELIKTHRVHLEKFGVLSFEMRKPNKNSNPLGLIGSSFINSLLGI